MDTPGLIWCDGQILPADAPGVPFHDRSLQHGLGLFETLRTWHGQPVLLDRHLTRLKRSAEQLGLGLEPEQMPEPADLIALIQASGLSGDARLRLTLSAGPASRTPGQLWAEAGPLPPPPPSEGQILLQGPDPEAATWPVFASDPLARHKTLNYWGKRLAHEAAQALGNTESLSRTPDGRFWEGSRTNLFVVASGRLVTPPTTGPLLPGVMRAVVLERAHALGLPIEEPPLTLDDLLGADEWFLTNALRGMLPVARVRDQERVSPGPITARLQVELDTWLRRSPMV